MNEPTEAELARHQSVLFSIPLSFSSAVLTPDHCIPLSPSASESDDNRPRDRNFPKGRTRTASDTKAFWKRVAKRRGKKGYR